MNSFGALSSNLFFSLTMNPLKMKRPNPTDYSRMIFKPHKLQRDTTNEPCMPLAYLRRQLRNMV